MDEKEPVAHAEVGVIEASGLKQANKYGFSDPYVEGHLGGYKFRTKIHKNDLSPRWLEKFKILIITWEAPNVLSLKLHSIQDHSYPDNLGYCSLNVNDFGDGQRHDLWLSLQNIETGRLHLAHDFQNIKTGRLHLAITILPDNDKVSLVYIGAQFKFKTDETAAVPSSLANIREVHDKEIGVKFVTEDSFLALPLARFRKKEHQLKGVAQIAQAKGM